MHKEKNINTSFGNITVPGDTKGRATEKKQRTYFRHNDGQRS